MSSKLFGRFLILTSFIPMVVKAQGAPTNPIDLVEEAVTKFLGCGDNFEDKYWNAVYEMALSTSAAESESSLSSLFEGSLLRARKISAPAGEVRYLANRLARLTRSLAYELPRQLNAKTRGEIQEVITSIEMGDRTSPLKKLIQIGVRRDFTEIKRLAEVLMIDCPDTEIQVPLAPEPSTAAKTGARQVMATMYQSCDPLTLSPLMTSESPIRGITIKGKHPNGIGEKRFITDRNAVNATHFYVRNIGAVKSGCKDVKWSPPIYDYGGKPNADSGALNMFLDGGTGTNVLGIDCSGFVFSSLAARGMKVKSAGALKANQVFGVNAAMFSDPDANGLTCLSRVKFSSGVSLKPGDIIASTGHVVLVDSVGADPFGLARAKKASDCTTSVLNSKGFSFNIIQSSPSQNGVGVNRMKAYDYLTNGSSFQKGLQAHAVQACKARFGGTAVVPDTTAYVVRHKDTSACQDKAVPLTYASCVSGCNVN